MDIFTFLETQIHLKENIALPLDELCEKSIRSFLKNKIYSNESQKHIEEIVETYLRIKTYGRYHNTTQTALKR